MKPLFALAIAAALTAAGSMADAQNKGTAGGAAAGAATGAVVGGPVGAVVGGVARATVGHETVDKGRGTSAHHRKAHHRPHRAGSAHTTGGAAPNP